MTPQSRDVKGGPLRLSATVSTSLVWVRALLVLGRIMPPSFNLHKYSRRNHRAPKMQTRVDE